MITDDEERYILECAWVPEHVVSLMVSLSKGEPFLMEGYLCYAGGDWLIVVGYPLEGHASPASLEGFLGRVVPGFHARYVWVMAPEIPEHFRKESTEREQDSYYRLDLGAFTAKAGLQRQAERALKTLTIKRSREFTREHALLIDEFLKREQPGARIRELYLGISRYVTESAGAVMLDARSGEGLLTAFYIVDIAAKKFATYVAGCHSKEHYVSHASDALFLEMARLARDVGKAYIHLGLGVNPGIRRFKKKWGGVPFLNYEYCELRSRRMNPLSLVKALESML